MRYGRYGVKEVGIWEIGGKIILGYRILCSLCHLLLNHYLMSVCWICNHLYNSVLHVLFQLYVTNSQKGYFKILLILKTSEKDKDFVFIIKGNVMGKSTIMKLNKYICMHFPLKCLSLWFVLNQIFGGCIYIYIYYFWRGRVFSLY